jgi:hypothetical protein
VRRTGQSMCRTLVGAELGPPVHPTESRGRTTATNRPRFAAPHTLLGTERRACVRPHTSSRARWDGCPVETRRPHASLQRPVCAPAGDRTSRAGRGVLGASDDGSNGVAAGERTPITLSRASCNGDYLGPPATRATQQRAPLQLPPPLLLMCTTDFHPRITSDAASRRSSDPTACDVPRDRVELTGGRTTHLGCRRRHAGAVKFASSPTRTAAASGPMLRLRLGARCHVGARPTEKKRCPPATGGMCRSDGRCDAATTTKTRVRSRPEESRPFTSRLR